MPVVVTMVVVVMMEVVAIDSFGFTLIMTGYECTELLLLSWLQWFLLLILVYT